MGLLTYIVLLALSGLVVGALARLALPGRDPLSIVQTIGLGIAGTFIAGLLVALVSGGRYGAGLPISIAASTVLMYFVRRSRGGGLVDPGGSGSGRVRARR